MTTTTATIDSYCDCKVCNGMGVRHSGNALKSARTPKEVRNIVHNLVWISRTPLRKTMTPTMTPLEAK